MMFSKGFAAAETKAAFAQATDLAASTDDFSERFIGLHGQWASALVRGELRAAREIASMLFREATDAGRAMETGIASRLLGLIAYFRGEFVEARSHCERALETREPNPDPKIFEFFAGEVPVTLSYLGVITWNLGEVERARELVDLASEKAAQTDIASMVDSLGGKSGLEISRNDPLATLSAAEAAGALAREHGMAQFINLAELHCGWARGRIDDPATGAAQARLARANRTSGPSV
jgi:hypothetical protein